MMEPAPREPDDAALVSAVAGGSEVALGVLYDRHVEVVHAVALRLAGDRQLAEEIVQETFLALWNRAELYNPAAGSLPTWLRAIARNRAIDRMRAAGRRPSLATIGRQADAGAASELERLAARSTVIGGAMPAAGPEEHAISAEAGAEVRDALATMGEEERLVIVLAYRDGLSQSEIAKRLDWPLGTVKTRTRRALSHLRAVLERDGVVAAGPGREDGAPG
jgi:RNA polymerase sigma-70 factor (ECF subfamily)